MYADLCGLHCHAYSGVRVRSLRPVIIRFGIVSACRPGDATQVMPRKPKAEKNVLWTEPRHRKQTEHFGVNDDSDEYRRRSPLAADLS